jgi:hypothetical protein
MVQLKHLTVGNQALVKFKLDGQTICDVNWRLKGEGSSAELQPWLTSPWDRVRTLGFFYRLGQAIGQAALSGTVAARCSPSSRAAPSVIDRQLRWTHSSSAGRSWCSWMRTSGAHHQQEAQMPVSFHACTLACMHQLAAGQHGQ